jgi:hypothetical protein
VTNSGTVNANAWEAGYTNSVVGAAHFTIQPGVIFTTTGQFNSGAFQMSVAAPVGHSYVLQVSADLQHWTSISTNTPSTLPFELTDPAPAGAARFYRVLQGP